MNRFKNILVYVRSTELSRGLIGRASQLAKHNGASLTISSCYEEFENITQNTGNYSFTKNIRQYMREEHEEHLNQLLKQHRLKKDSCTLKVMNGIPFIEIVREVINGRYDLVMLTSKNEPILGKSFYGSTVMHLLRKCPCPVWVFKSPLKNKFTTILAPIDAGTANSEELKINDRILDIACSLSASEKASLNILTCWSVFGDRYLRNRAEVTQSELLRYSRETKKQHDVLFKSFLNKNKLKNIKLQTHLLKGEPGKIIPTFVNKNKVDLIIMGTVARKGIKGYFIGNTAEKILHSVNCSILAIKSDSFISPIKL